MVHLTVCEPGDGNKWHVPRIRVLTWRCARWGESIPDSCFFSPPPRISSMCHHQQIPRNTAVETTWNICFLIYLRGWERAWERNLPFCWFSPECSHFSTPETTWPEPRSHVGGRNPMTWSIICSFAAWTDTQTQTHQYGIWGPHC